MSQAYKSMREASDACGLPRSFREDLTKHDRKRLHGDNAPPVFGWVLRETGTLLLDARMSRKNLRGFLDHVLTNGDTSQKFFIWDNFGLKPVDSADDWANKMECLNDQYESKEGNGGY